MKISLQSSEETQMVLLSVEWPWMSFLLDSTLLKTICVSSDDFHETAL